MNLESFYKISYGMYVVSSAANGKLNGQIANTLIQVTAEPPSLAVSINNKNLTHELISKSQKFSVSILGQDTPTIFIGKFGFKSGRELNKFADTRYEIGASGCPIVLDHTLAYMECEVIGNIDVITHTIFVGKAVNYVTLSDAEPMTYAYYRQVKKGTSSKNAPTYIKK